MGENEEKYSQCMLFMRFINGNVDQCAACGKYVLDTESRSQIVIGLGQMILHRYRTPISQSSLKLL
jgi:hypothetical protein